MPLEALYWLDSEAKIETARSSSSPQTSKGLQKTMKIPSGEKETRQESMRKKESGPEDKGLMEKATSTASATSVLGQGSNGTAAIPTTSKSSQTVPSPGPSTYDQRSTETGSPLSKTSFPSSNMSRGSKDSIDTSSSASTAKPNPSRSTVSPALPVPLDAKLSTFPSDSISTSARPSSTSNGHSRAPSTIKPSTTTSSGPTSSTEHRRLNPSSSSTLPPGVSSSIISKGQGSKGESPVTKGGSNPATGSSGRRRTDEEPRASSLDPKKDGRADGRKGREKRKKNKKGNDVESDERNGKVDRRAEGSARKAKEDRRS
ncbi:hypothetical protein BJ684DRAFT_21698 [Piptocephalis cylindrospora]|uniref:Uncharacterized protein n=1 Tax=Piptocephalis cylindrospora TaxID=1907219 RepID=A0A4P9Y0Y8_9FUNG|nr:hypothetical protein BJ684DRAFT_21698 [Piptocephalis cylindrospora]|eukprot:RKP11721.1 hypothetical protein BJ684DRAFT_21698 [Piptocephalis cylindrospora]